MANNKDVKRGIVLYLDGKQVESNALSIQKEMRKVKQEIDQCTFGSKEYVAATKRYRELNGILQEHRAKLRDVKTEHFSFINTINGLWQKWNVTIGAFMATFAGVSLALSKFRKEMHAEEESAANLKALTGLDDSSIEWLKQQAVELSTTMDRTGLRVQQSAKDILEAYMLVGSAKPELLKDKDALNAVTVEAMRLSTAAKMDLKAAVDAVTLSLNQYGESSDQAARYVNVLAAGSKFGAANVENQTSAIIKAGVAASTAKVPIESLVGSIETLAEKGIKGEVAGTGLKTFFLKLEGMADDVRPSVVGLETALENLRKKNLSTAETQKMFGLEAFTVAKAMIDGADKVNEYTQAVTGTNTAIEQAAINSDTANAKLAQMKNEFTQQGIILVQELNPAITRAVGLGMNSTKMLVSVVRFLTQFRTTLTLTSAAIAMYILWTKRKIIQDKLMVFWNEQVVISAYKVRYAFAKNPWGLALIAITAVVAAIIDYNRRLDENAEKGRAIKKLNDEVAEEYSKQSSKVELLNKLVHDNAAKLEDRRKALDELKRIVPDYLADLDSEGRLINDNKNKINDYLIALEKQIRLKAAQEDLEEAIRNKRKKEKEREGAKPDAAAARKNQRRSANSVYGGSQGNVFFNAGQVTSADNKVSQLDSDVKQLNDDIQDLYNEIKKGGGIASALVDGDGDGGSGGSGCSGSGNTTKASDRIKQETAKIEAEILRRQDIIKKMYASGKIDRQQYNRNMEELEILRIQRMLQIAGLEPEKVAELQNKITDIAVKAREALDSMEVKPYKDGSYEDYAARNEKLKQSMHEQLAILKQNLRLKNITSEQYDKEAKRIDAQYFLESTELWTEYYDKLKEVIDKNSTDLTESQKKQLELFQQTVKPLMESIGESIGSTLADALSGKSVDVHDAMLDILKEVVSAIQNMAVAYIAERTITNVGTLGVWGLAKAAGEIALITAAGATLNGLLENRKHSNQSSSGYASGGYTGSGGTYEAAGTVHKNEFVANRFALANPAVRSILDVIDNAQRSGSIANLSSSDLASVGSSSASTSAAYDASLALVAGAVQDCTRMLAVVKARFDEPIIAETYATGKHGTIEAEKLVEKMKSNTSR